MVNVEADVMVGPLLAARAREKGVVYSMAYGDQPAIICELVDWVHSCGFELTAAGKGMNFEPRYRYSTPDTVWGFFGWSPEFVAKGDFNPKMYNSFTDGTKAAIEMAAVANGTGLDCPEDGLAFPPAGVHDLARVFRPVADGGRLEKSGLLDIAASQEPDGREVMNNIRYGVFVTFKARDEYARACFKQYGLLTDPSGWYGSMWRPFHMIGLETSISVLSATLRGEATGSSLEFRADAVATAKKDMKAGEMLDGEGGFAVWAKAIPAKRSLSVRALPIGLAHNVKLKRAGQEGPDRQLRRCRTDQGPRRGSPSAADGADCRQRPLIPLQQAVREHPMPRYDYASRLNSFACRPELFWPGRNAKPTTLELIDRAGSVKGLSAIDLNYPDQAAGAPARELAARLKDRGLTLNGFAMRYGSDAAFKSGALTNADPATRQRAIDITRRGVDDVRAAGGDMLTLWLGQDGVDHPFQADFGRLWDLEIDGIRQVAEHDRNCLICHRIQAERATLDQPLARHILDLACHRRGWRAQSRRHPRLRACAAGGREPGTGCRVDQQEKPAAGPASQ